MKITFVLLFFFSFYQAIAQSTGTIEGQITDRYGAALPGANVILINTGLGTTTGSNGRFFIDKVLPGDYDLEVSYVGYEKYKQQVSVKPDERIQLSITLAELPYTLEGLVVTAQKRAQPVQEVPIAMTTYEAQFLQNTNTYEFDALSEYVPGLQVQLQSPNKPGFVVRGITSDNGDSRMEPRVSVFQDGVSISKSAGSAVELFDLERVEVLKGPQGTLFGRGAQIGAIHMIQHKPKNFTDAAITLGGGNLGQRLFHGYFNMPVVKDRLLFRIAGIYNKRNGFVDNLSGGLLNGKETGAFRTSIRWLPSDKTVVDLIYNYQKDTPPGVAFKSGVYAPKGGDTSPFTFADLERGEDLFVDRVVWGTTLLIDHTISNRLDFTSITAYREFDAYESFDADGTAAPVLWFAEHSYGQQFSQELRWSYHEGTTLSGFAGASFFYENGYQALPFETDERSFYVLLNPFLRDFIRDFPILSEEEKEELLTLVPELPLVQDGIPVLVNTLPEVPLLGNLSGAPLKSFHAEKQTNYGKNYATEIFGDATIHLTRQLDITAGLRGTYENISSALEVENGATPGTLSFILGNPPNNLFAPTDGRIEANKTFWSAVGRLAAHYQLNPNVDFFGTIARGRRPNVVLVNATETEIVNDEIVWSYEAGMKSLWNNQLQLDLNGYYYDYSDFQTVLPVLTDDGLRILTEDAGSATAIGFETALRYTPGKLFSVFINYSFIDATIDETDSEGNPQELAGNTFRLTPKHSGAAGLEWVIPVNPSLQFFFRPTYSYKSHVFFEEQNQSGIEQDGYGLLNLRAGINSFQDRMQVMFFISNALDVRYVIDAGNAGGAFGIPTFVPGPPRLWGIQITGNLR